jgi:hypothetical protein
MLAGRGHSGLIVIRKSGPLGQYFPGKDTIRKSHSAYERALYGVQDPPSLAKRHRGERQIDYIELAGKNPTLGSDELRIGWTHHLSFTILPAPLFQGVIQIGRISESTD